VATATLAFYLTANIDVLSPGPNPKKVDLGNGVTGYVGSAATGAGNTLTIRWRKDGIVYVIGRIGNERELIKVAQSFVHVSG
jgi:hypothetical protein